LKPTNAFTKSSSLAGDEAKAREVLDLAAKTDSKNAAFWTRLGKLYALLLFQARR